THIRYSAFQNCKALSSITLPDSVTLIGSQAFSETKIESFSFPKGVTGISEIFSDYVNSIYNTSLTAVTIPESVTSIDIRAFAGCTALSAIRFSGTTAQWENITKETNWHKDVPATAVVCSDGTVSIE
ncbi:MAG: leucine-rich repeat domain-containing protein, partial [Spirochaetaceae bacterium]|nr:leucine-rich repeat domain-containing protein [Spirochaetaceae bacterium]